MLWGGIAVAVGLRAPIQQTENFSGINADGFGDLTLIGKYAVLDNRATGDVLSAGLAVTLPTGRRIHLGDASRLRIVFVNLLSNALKYTPTGGEVVVRLAPEPVDADGPKLAVAVTDNGAGIPFEFRERVFEKFFRVEHHRPGTAEGVRGVGIGLYLCRQIVEAHRGHITCMQGEGGWKESRYPAAQPLIDGDCEPWFLPVRVAP